MQLWEKLAKQGCNWPWWAWGGTSQQPHCHSPPTPTPHLQVRHRVTADPLVQCHTATGRAKAINPTVTKDSAFVCVCMLGTWEVPFTL